jgi:hypothetical protein
VHWGAPEDYPLTGACKAEDLLRFQRDPVAKG